MFRPITCRSDRASAPLAGGFSPIAGSGRVRRLVAFGLIVGLLGGCTAPDETAEPLDVGHLDAFEPDSVTEVGGAAGSGIAYIVVSPSGGLDALSPVDPYLGCRVKWAHEEAKFINPCHGQMYDRGGACLSGPCIRGLDRYSVSVDGGQRVIVDTNLVALGPRRD